MSDTGTPIRTAYRFPDWEIEQFEYQKKRDKKTYVSWFPHGNRLDQDWLVEVTAHPSGAAHLGVLTVLRMVASAADARGMLMRDNGEPHTALTLAAKTRLPCDLIQTALDRFIEIAVLQVVPLLSRAESQRVNGHARPTESKQEITPVVNAPDFEPWWLRWCDATGRAEGKPAAKSAWEKHVTVGNISAVLECSENYFASRDVKEGAVTKPNRFLVSQASEQWAGRWPPAGKSAGKSTVAESHIFTRADYKAGRCSSGQIGKSVAEVLEAPAR